MVHESVRSHPRWCTTVSTGSRTGTEPSPTSPTENSSLAAPSNCGGDRSLAPRRQEQNHHPAGEGHHPLPASRRAEPVTSRDAITSSQPPLRGNRAGAGYPAGSYFINCQIAQCVIRGLAGAGPFGTTCSGPSTSEQLCNSQGGVGAVMSAAAQRTAASSPCCLRVRRARCRCSLCPPWRAVAEFRLRQTEFRTAVPNFRRGLTGPSGVTVAISSPAAASSAPKARPGDPAVPQWSPAAGHSTPWRSGGPPSSGPTAGVCSITTSTMSRRLAEVTEQRRLLGWRPCLRRVASVAIIACGVARQAARDGEPGRGWGRGHVTRFAPRRTP